MLKADIVMNDGAKLKDVMLFTNKNLGNSQIFTKDEAEKLLQGRGIVYFGGKYVQGGISVGGIADYFLFEDSEYIKSRLIDFVNSVDTINDKTGIANFVIEHREKLLELMK